MNGSTENGSVLNKHLNGRAKATIEEEEHDEDQYLNLIRKIMKKGERGEQFEVSES